MIKDDDDDDDEIKSDEKTDSTMEVSIKYVMEYDCR